MSIRLMSAAWSADICATDKIVLLALADHANDEGRCWPGVGSIKDKCGLSQRGVQNAIKRLCEAGHLSRIERSGTTALYRVHPRTTCTPAGDAPPQEVHPTPAPRAPKPSRTINPSEPTVLQEKARARESVKSKIGFAEFWAAYPRRTGKLAAEKAFAMAIKRGTTADHIVEAATRYAANPPDDPQFIPHPATWLNQGRYDDEPMEQNNGHGQRMATSNGSSTQPQPQYRAQPGWELFKSLRGRGDTGELDDDGSSGLRSRGVLSALEMPGQDRS